MWVSNDFLPGFEKVGWVTAKKLHKQYEELRDENEKVCYVDMCLLIMHVIVVHACFPAPYLFVCMQKNFLLKTAKSRSLKYAIGEVERPHERFDVDDDDPFREFGSLPNPNHKEENEGQR